MTDIRCWNRRITTSFIELYRKCPCLWNPRSKDYSNKHVKNEAYGKLVEYCKPIFPEANRDFVYKKIQSLRGAFRKELKKVRGSISKGSEVHMPSLWYYNLLMFTVDQEALNDNNSNADSEDLEDEPWENQQSGVEAEIDETDNGVVALQENQSTAFEQTLKRASAAVSKIISKKIKLEGSMEGLMRPCNETMKQSSTNATMQQSSANETTQQSSANATMQQSSANETTLQSSANATMQQSSANETMQQSSANAGDVSEFEAIGIKVAKQLQRMTPYQAILADSLIGAVLRRGLLNTLREETSLCDNSRSVQVTQCSCHD